LADFGSLNVNHPDPGASFCDLPIQGAEDYSWINKEVMTTWEEKLGFRLSNDVLSDPLYRPLNA
jgi:hypothetical protein